MTQKLDQAQRVAADIPALGKDSLGVWLSDWPWNSSIGKERWAEGVVLDMSRGSLLVQLWADREWLSPPERERVVTKLAGVRRGKNVPPHGHENMTSAFLVLHGEFDLRQYDKLKTNAGSLVIRQSRDERQGPGAWSSTSETLRNLHWLHAQSGDAFFFSTKLVHIVAAAPMKGRVNVDLRDAVDLGAGVLEAPIISGRRAHEIYNDT